MAKDYHILKQALPYLLHPETGIIGQISKIPPGPQGPELVHYQASVRMGGEAGGIGGMPLSGGASMDPDQAIAKTIGEAIERYSAGKYDRDDFIFGSRNSLGDRAVNSGEFALYSEQQYADPAFPYLPFNDDSPAWWVECLEPETGRSVLLPASMVYLPYSFDRESGEFPFSPSISTGLAAHTDPEQALLNGLLEVVERDAVCLTWQAALSHPRIDPESLPPRAGQLRDAFVRAGYTVDFIHAVHDSAIPVILGTLHGQSEDQVPFCLGAACGPDAGACALKVLEELALIEKTMQTIRPKDSFPLPDFNQIRNFHQQLLLWWHPQMTARADFLTASAKMITLESIRGFSGENPAEELIRATAMVRSAGYRVLTRDITPADMGDLGFHAVRVVIPGFVPLMPGFPFRSLGGQRLWTVPQQLGYAGIDHMQGDYAVPHPFC